MGAYAGSTASSQDLLVTQAAQSHRKPAKSTQGTLFQTLCSALHLQILYYAIASRLWGNRVDEETKMPVKRSRPHAILRCTIHVIPVAAALLLVSFNLHGYYIGGELAGAVGQDTQKLAGLQFAAKLHELLMLASLGVVVFTMVRKELVSIRGLPFGAVFATSSIDTISTLWSLEYWGLLYDAWKQKKGRRWFLVALITICIILGVSVGPSTANLMRPRLDNWPAGGSTFWLNSTTDALFPTKLVSSPTLDHCLIDTGDLACPYGGYDFYVQQFLSFWKSLGPLGDMPKSVDVPGAYSVPQMLVNHRSTGDNTRSIWWTAWTMATMPPMAVSDGLATVGRFYALAATYAPNRRRFRYRKDFILSVATVQPMALVLCQGFTASPSSMNMSIELDFVDLQSISVKPVDAGLSGFATYTFTEEFGSVEVSQKVSSMLQSGSPPDLLWIDDAGILNGSGSTLTAIATIPGVSNGSNYYCCSIDSRQANVSLQTTRSSPKIVTGVPNDWTTIGTYNDAWIKIYPSASWAAYTNPQTPPSLQADINGTNVPLFANLLASAMPAQPYNTIFIVESILATMLTNGLARVAYNTGLTGTLKGQNDPNNPWAGGAYETEFLPKGALGYGGNAYDISVEQAAGATQLTMLSQATGYAYSSEGITQQAAIAVLIVYGVLAVLHFLYSSATGFTSSSWDRSPEMTALALNSEKTARLNNTGAGIATVSTFEEPTWIWARGGKVELVLVDTKGGATPLVENIRYG